jgi:hypothetical protein
MIQILRSLTSSLKFWIEHTDANIEQEISQNPLMVLPYIPGSFQISLRPPFPPEPHHNFSSFPLCF